jgi:hypothetical protein
MSIALKGGCKITNDKGVPIDPISGHPIPEYLKISVRVANAGGEGGGGGGADVEYCFDIREFWGRYETRQYVTYKKGWAFFPAAWVNNGIKNPSTNIPFTKSEMIQIYKQIHRDNLMVTDTFADDVFWMANSPRHVGELRRILQSKFTFLTDKSSTELVLEIAKDQEENGKKMKGIFCIGLPNDVDLKDAVFNIPFVYDLIEKDHLLYPTSDIKESYWVFFKI